MIRLLLANGHRSFVEALAITLDAEPGLQVVAAVVEPEQVLRVVLTRPVDVAALTVDGRDSAYLGSAHTLLEARPRLRLVAVSERDDADVAARAVRAGFRAWVRMDVGVRALVEVLEAVCRGESCIPPLLLTQLLPYLLRERGDGRAGDPRLASLTSREEQVLKAMCSGATRGEMAEQFAISPNTVRTHMQHILAKLDVHTSLAAVTLARRAGMS